MSNKKNVYPGCECEVTHDHAGLHEGDRVTVLEVYTRKNEKIAVVENNQHKIFRNVQCKYLKRV